MKFTPARDLILIPFSCLFGALAGYLLPASWKPDLVAHSAWGICLLFLVLTSYLIFRAYRRALTQAHFKRNGPILVLSAAIVLIFSQIDHRANKVILDELILQATALQLLENNEYRTPQFAHNLNNEYSIHSGFTDKRPPLFPVTLSLVHRFLGYNQSNGYLLNALLGFGVFVLLGKIGEHFYPRAGAYLAILSFASLPLLSQNITGQHFEILNLFLIAFLFYTSIRIVNWGKSDELPLAYLLAAGLALTRYEGLLFFIVPYLVHLHAAWKGRPSGSLLPVYLVCPVSVAFLFALLTFVFSNPDFWQLEDMQNTQAFGLTYWAQNLGAFMDFMLITSRRLPGSLPLAVLGMASLFITLVHLFKDLAREIREKDTVCSALPLAALFISLLLFLLLVFSYHWGQVNTHLTARFLLFPFLFMVVSILYALKKEPFWLFLIAALLALFAALHSRFIEETPLAFAAILVVGGILTLMVLCVGEKRLKHLPTGLFLFWGLYGVTETLPAINQRAYESLYTPMHRTTIYMEWVKDYGGGNAFFMANAPYYGILSREPSMSIERFALHPERLMGLFEARRFADLYAMQEILLDGEGNFSPAPGSELPDKIAFETIEMKRVTSDFGVRLVRITGVIPEEDPSPSE